MLTSITKGSKINQHGEGFGMAFILSPLAADISLAAEQLEREHEGIFGPGGPDSQAYGLFNSAHAAGLVLGPAFAGAVYDRAGWDAAVWALAGLCASGIPVVMFHDMQSLELSHAFPICDTNESIGVLHRRQEDINRSCAQSSRRYWVVSLSDGRLNSEYYRSCPWRRAVQVCHSTRT